MRALIALGLAQDYPVPAKASVGLVTGCGMERD